MFRILEPYPQDAAGTSLPNGDNQKMPTDMAVCSRGQGKGIPTDWEVVLWSERECLVGSGVEGSWVSICTWRFVICLEVTYMYSRECASVFYPKCPKAADNLLAAGDFLEITLETDSVWSASRWFMESVELYFSLSNQCTSIFPRVSLWCVFWQDVYFKSSKSETFNYAIWATGSC